MILLGISLVALAAWVSIAMVRLPVFRPLPQLTGGCAPDAWPEVAVVIPARDEAETIGAVIAAHLASVYPGRLTIILVDDHSSDGTGEIALGAAWGAAAQSAADAALMDRESFETLSPDRSLRICRAPTLQSGWTGKLSAVNAGIEEMRAVAPDARYALLCDADIVFDRLTLEKLVAEAELNNLALTSLMARLDARGFWGGLLIPAFVFFFQKLYPFHRSNIVSDPIAAAAGGCMLVRADALAKIGGVSSIKDRLIDDCALAAAIKQSGGKIWLGIAKDEALSLRDNRSLKSIWKMVARTAFTQLGYSWLMTAGAVIGMIILYLAAPVVALSYPFHGNAAAAAISATAWAFMALAYMPTARIYEQAPIKTFALPLAAALYTAMTLTSAVDYTTGRGGAWKGRIYP